MDLYQIFVTHNRPWTIREIFCFSVIFIIAAAVSCYLLYQKKIVCSQAVSGLLLLIFLGIVFASTVFTRVSDGIHNYELELFWSWRAVRHGSQEMLKENLLNMILLFPMGILLPIMFGKRLTGRAGLFIGIAVSAVIEICQLVFCRGLFEWDDMLHNGIGCMVGCLISRAVMKRRNRNKNG